MVNSFIIYIFSKRVYTFFFRNLFKFRKKKIKKDNKINFSLIKDNNRNLIKFLKKTKFIKNKKKYGTLVQVLRSEFYLYRLFHRIGFVLTFFLINFYKFIKKK